MSSPDSMSMRVGLIVSDPDLTRAEKVAALHELEADVLALQREATEGGPVPDERGADLRAIENALVALGERPHKSGPASL